LASWLKEKIYASLPDRVLKDLLAGDPSDGRPTGTSDGRLVALCLLAEATAVSSPAKRGRPGGGFATYPAPRPSAPQRLQAIADCLPDIESLPAPKVAANPLRADIELGRGCTPPPPPPRAIRRSGGACSAG